MRCLLAFAACSTLLTGCEIRSDPAEDVQAVIQKCDLEGRLTAEVAGDRLRTVHLDTEVDHRKVGCFVAGVAPLGLNLGLVGNEMPERR